jgi:hypothetical protein
VQQGQRQVVDSCKSTSWFEECCWGILRLSLVEVFVNIGFQLTKADSDIWIHSMGCDNGFEYYEMLFIFVDDIFALSHKARHICVKEITKLYKARDGSVKPPDIYFGLT